MSTIQPNRPAVCPAPIKRPEGPQESKCPTPQDVADGLRVQADQDMQRADELKAEAERLRSEGTNTAAAGAATVAEGIANVGGGKLKIAEGKSLQEQGQTQLAEGLDLEQEGLAKEQAGIDAYSSSLAEAQELNNQSKVVSAMAALGVMAEGIASAQVNEHNKTFAEQLAEARGIATELGTQLTELEAQSAKEAEANNQVIAGNAQFDAGLEQNRQGTASLIAGVANQTKAAGSGELAAQAEKDGNVYQIHSETHQALSDENKNMSIETSILAGQEFASATKLENKASKQEDLGNNALSVSDLLARVAGIDQEAGNALQQIPGFLAEGNTTLADAQNKLTDSENRRQDGLTHLNRAENFRAESEVRFHAGVEYAKEAADRAQASKDLGDQAASEKESADAKFAQSNELKAQAAEQQALGDEQVAQGKKDRLEGSMTAAAGLASMTGGLVAEQQAHDAMNATSANIPGITERQTASQDARSETLAKADEAYGNVEEALNFQQQTVEVQAQLAAEKQANFEGRVNNLAQIVEGEQQQTDGYNAQHEGLDNVQAGTDQERAGHEQVTTGQNQIALGKTKVHEGTQQIKKGDQTGQAGAVLEDKANKYNAIADEVQGGGGQGQSK